jgi:hypothetical protein
MCVLRSRLTHHRKYVNQNLCLENVCLEHKHIKICYNVPFKITELLKLELPCRLLNVSDFGFFIILNGAF